MNKYRYEVTWTTKDNYGTLEFCVIAISKRQAIDRALKYLPPNCIAINVSRVC